MVPSEEDSSPATCEWRTGATTPTMVFHGDFEPLRMRWPTAILIGPILANKIFVDDGDGLTSEAVLVGEGASVEQANSHGVEICGADLADIAVWTGVAGRQDASFNSE